MEVYTRVEPKIMSDWRWRAKVLSVNESCMPYKIKIKRQWHHRQRHSASVQKVAQKNWIFGSRVQRN